MVHYAGIQNDGIKAEKLRYRPAAINFYLLFFVFIRSKDEKLSKDESKLNVFFLPRFAVHAV